MHTVSLAVLILITACSRTQEPSELLKEANEVHLEAMEIYEEAHELFGRINEQAKAEEASEVIAKLDSIHDLLHNWKDGLYEVPGFEHTHDHAHEHEGHSHEHHHTAAPSMTDQSMLEYQKTAKEAIEELLEALKQLQ